MRRSILLAAVLAVAFTALPAAAVPGNVVVALGFDYIPGSEDVRGQNYGGLPSVVLVKGTELVLVNPDFWEHTVTSWGCGGLTAEPCRFDSEVAPPGGAVVVRGTDQLEPGLYRFFCRIETDMRATLRVVI